MNYILSSLINSWVGLTGYKKNLKDVPWLNGPYGENGHIGKEFYKEFAKKKELNCIERQSNGLVVDFTHVLGDDDSNKDRLQEKVKHFYENTSDYKLDVWSEWYHPVKYFAHVLIRTVSSGIDQLNIPLSPLETSRGMSNEVIGLVDKEKNQLMACWLRKTVLTKKVVYAGFYSIVKISDKPFIRVVFPLPEGSATVLLRVEVQEDGSVKLISDGKRPGGAGYYRVKVMSNDKIRYKFIPLKELIHVYTDENNVLRTDHVFWYWGMKFLQLHYKMELVPSK